MSDSRFFTHTTDDVKHISLFSTDADGCLYNANYINLIMHIISKYHTVFADLNKKKEFDDQDKLFYEKIIGDIKSVKLESLSFDKLEKELFELIKPETISALRVLRKESLAKFFENSDGANCPPLNQDEMNQISSIIKCNVNLLVYRYLNFIRNIENDIYVAILYKTNVELTKYILNTIWNTKVDIASNINFSTRQDRDLDLRGQAENRTGLIFEDIFHIGKLIHGVLKGARLEKPFSTSDFSMADIHDGLIPGTTVKLMKMDVNNAGIKHPEHVCDHTKGTIVYGQAHSAALEAMHEYKAAKIDIYIFDNLFDILAGNKEQNKHGLYTFYTSYPFLLPKNVKLHLIIYDGEVGEIFTVQGVGEIDENYQENIRLMVRMCREKLSNAKLDTLNIDMTNDLDVNEFWQRKIVKQSTVLDALVVQKMDAGDGSRPGF